MRPKLRAITFLAPNILPVYHFMCVHLGEKLGYDIELASGSDYREVYGADLVFICGLPYVLLTNSTPFIEAIIAPVLQGNRFQNRPIYFSDVIVHRDSPFHSFADLRGCSWAYNEPKSQSGYGITRYHLAKLGETNGYFGQVIESGFHQKSIQMVCDRKVDASAIDAQVLAVEMRNHPDLASRIQVIDSLGPSTIQPLTIASHLSVKLKQDIQTILTEIHLTPAGRICLDSGFIDRLVAVDDTNYNDIRNMRSMCKRAKFLHLK